MVKKIDNVILLGAGASKSEGAPLQGELLGNIYDTAMFSKSDKIAKKLQKSLKLFLKDFFGINHSYIHSNMPLPTFEEILGVIEIAIKREESFGYSKNTNSIYEQNLRKDLILMIALILQKKLRNKNKYHKEIVIKLARKKLIRKTAFISFNYDILIDNALIYLHGDNNSDGIDYHIDYGLDFLNFKNKGDWHKPTINKAVKLFKLHGSLNWLYCPTCSSLTLTPKKKGVCLLVYDEQKCNCQQCSKMMVPIIIPPTYFKAMSNYFLQQIWHDAEEVLRECNKLFFCGYSFPDADVHIKYLLKRAELFRQKPFELFIVNGKGSDEENNRFKRFFADTSNINFTGLTFEEFTNDVGKYVK